MVRIDMSEYMEKFAFRGCWERLRATWGYDQGGELTEKGCAGARIAWCCLTR